MKPIMSVPKLLSGISAADVRMEPYPHLVIENALPDAEYRQLDSTFPEIDDLKQIFKTEIARTSDNKKLKRSLRHLKRRNRRVNVPSKLALDSELIDECWKQFLDYHSSDEFFKELYSIFEEPISQWYPEFAKNADQCQASRRGAEKPTEVTVDAMVAMNTPSWFKSSITGPHTDHPRKMFIGLFYMQDERDTAGGDLMIYRRQEPVNDQNLKWPPENTVECVQTIRYRPNTLVILLNTPESVHGVTMRNRSKYPRRFVNLIAEARTPFF